MKKYIPLTKQIIKDGKQMAVCCLYDTDKCHQLHNGVCANCPMFNNIVEMLNVFENIYIEKDK